MPCHTGLVLMSDRGSALGRIMPDKTIRLIKGDRDAFGLRGRSAEQRIALDLLLDPDIGIVSIGGRAGTGKSALAMCAGLEAVMETPPAPQVIVFRPLYASVARNWATCRVPRRRRWGPGRRPSSTPSAPWSRPRSSRRSWRAACSKCSH